MITLPLPKLLRVNRRNLCPICDKPDWCGIAADGSIAICMRIAAGAVSGSKNQGYVHILREQDRSSINPSSPIVEQAQVASISRRHVVYEALLELLPLADEHAENLTSRGLSDLTIARNGYATLPRQVKESCKICETLAIFHDPMNVPGFFRDKKGYWRFVLSGSGFLIPVRDIEGRIQGCQVRLDRGETRYIWLSSVGKSGGASSGAPIHFARPWRALDTNEAIITEGALKADVIAEKLDCCVVGIPGVASFALNFGSWLTLQLPNLRSVLVAYDADWRDKSQVRAALARLLDSLSDADLAGYVLDWSGAKGLDDLLAKERK
jgi:hypothetical protein